MQSYLLRRLWQSALTLVGVSLLVFVILRVIPGDPAKMLLPEGAPQSAVEELNRALGLREPIWVQYGIFLRSVVRGDFGQWFTKAGAEKLTRFSDPRVEQLIAEGRVPDPKVRQQKYEEIDRLLWEDEPEIWPYYTVAIYAISDRLRNFEARRDYYVLLHEVGIA